MSMKLHFLDARGALSDVRDWVEDGLLATHERAAALMPLGPLDVVVQAGRHVIPEKGHLGYAPRPGVIFITLDTHAPSLHANENASLERMFAHELHHAARWDGPGYGTSLGEALVTEGLASHFAQELFGGRLEPWEDLPKEEVRSHAARAAKDWERTDYDHEAWFFGMGDLSRWIGYSLGFRLVEQFLAGDPERRASKMSSTDAREFQPKIELI